jgi:hypothetical protein
MKRRLRQRQLASPASEALGPYDVNIGRLNTASKKFRAEIVEAFCGFSPARAFNRRRKKLPPS